VASLVDQRDHLGNRGVGLAIDQLLPSLLMNDRVNERDLAEVFSSDV